MNWNIFHLFRRKPEITYEQLILSRLTEIQDAQSKFFANLANLVSSAIKKYVCIICGAEYARLPAQSEKRIAKTLVIFESVSLQLNDTNTGAI